MSSDLGLTKALSKLSLKVSKPPKKPFRLLDLPLELRIIIYEFFFGRRSIWLDRIIKEEKGILPRAKWRRYKERVGLMKWSSIAILLVSHQLHTETENIFTNGLWHSLGLFTLKNLKQCYSLGYQIHKWHWEMQPERVQRLRLVYHASDIATDSRGSSKGRAVLWKLMDLPCLKELKLVIIPVEDARLWDPAVRDMWTEVFWEREPELGESIMRRHRFSYARAEQVSWFEDTWVFVVRIAFEEQLM